MLNDSLGRASILALVLVSVPTGSLAQDMPPEYRDVLTALGRQGDFKDNVLKVNIPRNDVKVTVAGIATPTPFGFGGWVAMTRGDGGDQVLMGDLVLLQAEVNPVMSALLDNGFDVTALHNHFFLDEPRMFYMHLHGHGTAADLARKLKPAIDLIGPTAGAAASVPASGSAPPPRSRSTPASWSRSWPHRGSRRAQSTSSRCRGPTSSWSKWGRRSTPVWD